MKLKILLVASSIAVALPAYSAAKRAPQPAAKPLYLECGFETSKGQEYIRLGDYIFEVQAAKMKLIDLNSPSTPFQILSISSSKIEAVNRNIYYALEIMPNTDTTYLTINRISGSSYFSFTKAPTADEVKTCLATPTQSGEKPFWCNDPPVVGSKGGACRPTKPKF